MTTKTCRILVVDDQAMFRMLVTAVLRKSDLDCEIVEANDGSQALDLMQTKDFDLIITDLNMPQISGLDLICKVRQHPTNRFAKICVVSGSDEKSELTKARQCGANAFVEKPLNKENLLNTVNRLMR